eukprot:268087-Alexandrium_andersonii.AAC.1
MHRHMGEQRAMFEQQLAAMKAQMEEQMGAVAQAIDSVKLDADNARKNEEQLKRELVELKCREIQLQMAAESKAHEKMWYPVGGDIGVAAVTAATTTIPARA